jgi:hypothetical protein
MEAVTVPIGAKSTTIVDRKLHISNEHRRVIDVIMLAFSRPTVHVPQCGRFSLGRCCCLR